MTSSKEVGRTTEYDERSLGGGAVKRRAIMAFRSRAERRKQERR